jgi:hypothetical protein
MKYIKKFYSNKIENLNQDVLDINEREMTDLPLNEGVDLMLNIMMGLGALVLVGQMIPNEDKKKEREEEELKKITGGVYSKLIKSVIPGISNADLVSYAESLKEKVDKKIEDGEIKSYKELEEYAKSFIDLENSGQDFKKTWQNTYK